MRIVCVCTISAILPASLKGKRPWQMSSLTNFPRKMTWAELACSQETAQSGFNQEASPHGHNQPTKGKRGFTFAFVLSAQKNTVSNATKRCC